MRIRFRSLSEFLLVLISLLFVPSLFAQIDGADCRSILVNRTFAGNFAGYLNLPVYSGEADNGSIGVVPNAGAGWISFLPGGRVINTETILVGLLGLNRDRQITGNYSLVWDAKRNPAVCVGAIHASDGSTSYDFQLIVASDGDRIEMIHTNTGLIVGTSMFPMHEGNCRNSTVKGTYTYNSSGWALAYPPAPADQMLSNYVPGAMSGAMRFYPNTAPDAAFPDAAIGAGSVAAWDTLSANGAVLPSLRTMTGWYKVNRSCMLSLTLVDGLGNPPFQIEGFVGQRGQIVYAVNTNTLEPEDNGPPIFLMPITLTRVEAPNEQP